MTTMGLSRRRTRTQFHYCFFFREMHKRAERVCRFAIVIIIFREKCAFILYILIKTWLGDYGCWYNIRSHLARRIVNGYTPMPNIPKNCIVSISSDSHVWRGARQRANVPVSERELIRFVVMCARSTRVRRVFVTRQIKLFQYFNWVLHLSNRYNDGAPSWVIIIWRTEREGSEHLWHTATLRKISQHSSRSRNQTLCRCENEFKRRLRKTRARRQEEVGTQKWYCNIYRWHIVIKRFASVLSIHCERINDATYYRMLGTRHTITCAEHEQCRQCVYGFGCAATCWWIILLPVAQRNRTNFSFRAHHFSVFPRTNTTNANRRLCQQLISLGALGIVQSNNAGRYKGTRAYANEHHSQSVKICNEMNYLHFCAVQRVQFVFISMRTMTKHEHALEWIDFLHSILVCKLEQLLLQMSFRKSCESRSIRIRQEVRPNVNSNF